MITPRSARAMGTFFPHFPSQAFTPFFREFDSLFQPEAFGIRPQQTSRPFTPRFDVHEVPSAYELQGELPGIKQEDIDIEFVDANTLVIKGKTTRESTRTNHVDVKGQAIEGTSRPKAMAADNPSENSSNFQKASVEDEGEREGGASTATEETLPPASTNATELAPAQAEQSGYKYWISERSVGEFQRTFSFPGKVDQEAVKASLKDGILSIIVPKAAKQERKIAIE
ncbi:MAG: hypothetical protein L6R39_000480 [Caloplaca ligustica]|nr:MAG: hypothetical protein L6R39_000480 [Caloplaca ligustica]